jgi:hypothetical protein
LRIRFNIKAAAKPSFENVSGSSSLTFVMSRNMHEGIWKVLRKFRKSQMSSAAFTSTTKSALKALIEREAIRTGSRTVAYEIVAQTIGASTSWIRKFLAYDDAVAEPRYTLFHNIASYYDSICTRVEQEQQTERAKYAALKVELDAVAKSFDRLVDGSTRTGAIAKTPATEGE